VGVDNFITVFTDAKFYLSIVKTLKFGALSLGIGFLVPIVLAVMLTEIPRGRVFLRTVYFLPQISSGLVVLFIWKLMYNETEYGLLNQLLLASNTLPLPVVALVRAAVVAVAALVLWVLYRLAFTLEHSSRAGRVGFRLLFFAVAAVFAAGPAATVLRFGPLAAARDVAAWFLRSPGFTAQNWLGDPRWTMAAVIVPGVWAGAGMSSLLYLAALKCVDEESYEAADLDGAGSLAKAWYITIPYLKPLILINFIGAFIGVFRSMGGIFAMTGGGPGDETTVLSLLIWIKAFANLRFGEATALAWVLGVALIAFAVFQLRILKRVEFRRADQN
jgi:multiple sugar transport system permease protein